MQQYPPDGPQGQIMPLYENRYMGFYIKVFPDHVEFKNGQGVQIFHLNQVSSVQTGVPLFMGIYLTINGQQQMIPTSKKKEVERAILDAKRRLFAPGPQMPPIQVMPVAPPMQPATPAGTPIDIEIQRIKLEIQQVGLQLKQVNANMANARAKYSQHHVHGGGKLGGFVRGVQRASKDGKLAGMQPTKEKLQRQKLALEQQLTHLKMLKAQGVTHITH